MVNLINLHFMLKETFQLSFNNYIFKVNSSKESKKKKLRLNIKTKLQQGFFEPEDFGLV